MNTNDLKVIDLENPEMVSTNGGEIVTSILLGVWIGLWISGVVIAFAAR